jgi:hypothetical protein
MPPVPGAEPRSAAGEGSWWAQVSTIRAAFRDLLLRDGSWDFAITSDFVDVDAYRTYDREAEHNRVRREMFAPLCVEIARVQFEA